MSSKGIMSTSSPKNSKGSQGRVERFHRTIEEQCRILISSLNRRYLTTITGDNEAIIQWAIRHAAFLYERFHVSREDKSTPYRRHQARDYGSALVPFGETIMWRDPTGSKYKLSSAWGHGIWLGRDVRSDSHIVGTRQGVHTARSIRRLASSERHDRQLLFSI